MNEYVVNWENGGEALRRYTKSHFYAMSRTTLKQALHGLCSGLKIFAVRYKTEGFLFDVSGSSMFPQEEQTAELLGFLCSKVAFTFCLY